jgi:hypothetical protein
VRLFRVFHDKRASRAPTFFFDLKKPERASLEEIKTAFRLAFAQCAALKRGLEQVNPLVIDYYLGWNPALQKIGRLLIAWVILECEHAHRQNGANINRKELLINSPYEAERLRVKGLDLKRYKDDWCRFVIHQLAINCKSSGDLLGNKVRFVTFNYDLSLERAIYIGLWHIERFRSEQVIEFLGDDRVLHIYGKIRQKYMDDPPLLNWSEQSRDLRGMGGAALEQCLSAYKTLFDYFYNASQDIQVIDDDKAMNLEVIKTAIDAIGSAEHIYILGYGFDENNSERLQLPQQLNYQRTNGKSVFFTNFQTINRVTKRASEIFFGRSNAFAKGVLVEPSGNNNHYERSLRDVYEALELDFDWFD